MNSPAPANTQRGEKTETEPDPAQPPTQSGAPARHTGGGTSSRARAEQKPARNTGKRYSPASRQRILQFLADYNREHGRGGVTAASKKFHVSIPTLAQWMRREQNHRVRSHVLEQPAPTPFGDHAPASAAPSVRGDRFATLQRMTEIQAEIQRLEQEFEALKNTL